MKNRQRDRQIVEGRTDKQMDRWKIVEGQTDRQMDRHTDVEGQVDRQTDGRTERQKDSREKSMKEIHMKD